MERMELIWKEGRIVGRTEGGKLKRRKEESWSEGRRKVGKKGESWKEGRRKFGKKEELEVTRGAS